MSAAYNIQIQNNENQKNADNFIIQILKEKLDKGSIKFKDNIAGQPQLCHSNYTGGRHLSQTKLNQNIEDNNVFVY